MHHIDVALRRSASDAFGAPQMTRGPLARRAALALSLVLVLQLVGGLLADPSRAEASGAEAAAPGAGGPTAGSAVAVHTDASAAAASRLSIAVAAHVDPVERDDAFEVLRGLGDDPAIAGATETVDRVLDAALPPRMVAAWWASIPDAQREAISEASPRLVGNLDGIPLDDRVAANRSTAAERLATLPRTPSRLASAEASYLARVSAAAVSLYAFDVTRDAIVEVVGDPTTATRALIFTPGTTASLSDFYSGSIQSMASWEVDKAAGTEPTVAFVAKIGTFPEWSLTGGPLDNRRSIELGVLFDRFNDGLDATAVGELPRTSVEHSFGSSIGGVAETLGTHFDTRIVLGGVGMIAGWQPSEQTRYVAYVAGNDVTRYIYGVVDGEETGFAVSPSVANGFEQRDPGLASEGWYLPLRVLAGAIGPAIEVLDGFINHNRVASADGNTSVLESILADLVRSGVGEVVRHEKAPAAPPAPVRAAMLFLPARESQPESR